MALTIAIIMMVSNISPPVNAYTTASMSLNPSPYFTPVNCISTDNNYTYKISIRADGLFNSVDLFIYDIATGLEVEWWTGYKQEYTLAGEERIILRTTTNNINSWGLESFSNLAMGDNGVWIVGVISFGVYVGYRIVTVYYDMGNERWEFYISANQDNTLTDMLWDSNLNVMNPDHIINSISKPFYKFDDGVDYVSIVYSYMTTTYSYRVVEAYFSYDTLIGVNELYTRPSNIMHRIGLTTASVNNDYIYYIFGCIGSTSNNYIMPYFLKYGIDTNVNELLGTGGGEDDIVSNNRVAIIDSGYFFIKFPYTSNGIRYVRCVYYDGVEYIISRYDYNSGESGNTPINTVSSPYGTLSITVEINDIWYAIILTTNENHQIIYSDTVMLGTDYFPSHYDNSLGILFEYDDEESFIIYEESFYNNISYIYFNLTNGIPNPPPEYIYDCSLSYAPYDNPAYVNKQYTFTLSAIANNTSFNGYAYILNNLGVVTRTLTIIDGNSSFISYFSTVGTSNITVQLIQPGGAGIVFTKSFLFPVTTAQTGGGTGGGTGFDWNWNGDSTVFMNNLLDVAINMLPYAIMILFPAFALGQKGGVIGYAIGGLMGFAMATYSGILPMYWVYLVALLVIMAFVMTLRKN